MIIRARFLARRALHSKLIVSEWEQIKKNHKKKNVNIIFMKESIFHLIWQRFSQEGIKLDFWILIRHTDANSSKFKTRTVYLWGWSKTVDSVLFEKKSYDTRMKFIYCLFFSLSQSFFVWTRDIGNFFSDLICSGCKQGRRWLFFSENSGGGAKDKQQLLNSMRIISCGGYLLLELAERGGFSPPSPSYSKHKLATAEDQKISPARQVILISIFKPPKLAFNIKWSLSMSDAPSLYLDVRLVFNASS